MTEEKIIADERTLPWFIDICSKYGIEVSINQGRKLLDYLSYMLEKNQYLNLTAIRDWDRGLILHLLDSLLFLEDFDYCYPDLRDKPFLDMGTGAGLPGIPLAIMREDRKGVLCDSVKKKIAAVDEFIEKLNLQPQLHTSTERIEALARRQSRSYGCIVARAVGSLPVLIEYSAPLLWPDGCLIVSKGRPEQSEFDAGREAARLCGLSLVSDHIVDLPEDYGQRRFLVYEKTSEPKIPLPRPIGMAAKKPLA